MVVCPYCQGDISKCTCFSLTNSYKSCEKECKDKCKDSSKCKKDEDGVYCRACNEFNKYAEPDKVINDGKNTCWNCKNHPERRKKGLPQELKDIIHKIFPIK